MAKTRSRSRRFSLKPGAGAGAVAGVSAYNQKLLQKPGVHM